MGESTEELVWYAAYGSNLDARRFSAYLQGGRPPGGMVAAPGARDPSPPRDDRPLTLPGRLLFGWESPTWGGGVAFLDAAAEPPGTVWARAYLLTRGQFADVAAQEMHRAPEADLDLAEVLASGRHSYGPGHYETLHLAGELDGVPVLTFSCGDLEHLPRNAPSGAYLATIVRGLRAGHQPSDDQITDYLLACEGMETWAPDEVSRLVAGTR